MVVVREAGCLVVAEQDATPDRARAVARATEKVAALVKVRTESE